MSRFSHIAFALVALLMGFLGIASGLQHPFRVPSFYFGYLCLLVTAGCAGDSFLAKWIRVVCERFGRKRKESVEEERKQDGEWNSTSQRTLLPLCLRRGLVSVRLADHRHYRGNLVISLIFPPPGVPGRYGHWPRLAESAGDCPRLCAQRAAIVKRTHVRRPTVRSPGKALDKTENIGRLDGGVRRFLGCQAGLFGTGKQEPNREDAGRQNRRYGGKVALRMGFRSTLRKATRGWGLGPWIGLNPGARNAI